MLEGGGFGGDFLECGVELFSGLLRGVLEGCEEDVARFAAGWRGELLFVFVIPVETFLVGDLEAGGDFFCEVFVLLEPCCDAVLEFFFAGVAMCFEGFEELVFGGEAAGEALEGVADFGVGDGVIFGVEHDFFAEDVLLGEFC